MFLYNICGIFHTEKDEQTPENAKNMILKYTTQMNPPIEISWEKKGNKETFRDMFHPVV